MPRTINTDVLAQMYSTGIRLAVICRYLGCSRSAAKDALNRLGVPRRPLGWKPAGYAQMMKDLKRVAYARNPKSKNPDAKRNRRRRDDLLLDSGRL